MKTVTRKQYMDFLRKHNRNGQLRDNVVEGHALVVMELINAAGIVVASALYQKIVEGQPVSVTYLIRV